MAIGTIANNESGSSARGKINATITSANSTSSFSVTGAKGDGVTDDTTAVNATLASSPSVTDRGTFLVTALNNPKGTPILGRPKIVKSVTVGSEQKMEQQNTYADNYQFIVGREYALPIVAKLLATTPIKVSMSGDSTTEGAAVGTTIPDALKPAALMQTLVNNYGLNMTFLNRGHSGKTTADWKDTYLAADLAENPDVYICSWAINDPGAGISFTQTIANLDSILSTIRSTRDAGSLVIVLASPNSTYHLAVGADAKYYEDLTPALINLARKYKCMFFDKYGLWQDSKVGAITGAMDSPAAGVTLHPLGHFNIAIYSMLFETLIPAYFRTPHQYFITRSGYTGDSTTLFRADETFSTAVSGAGVALQTLLFNTNNGLTNNGAKWYGETGTNNAFTAFGVAQGLSLAANADGSVQCFVDSLTGNVGAIYGFKTGATAEPFNSGTNSYKAAFYITDTAGINVLDNGGTPVATGESATQGRYYRVNRTGTAFTLVESTNAEFTTSTLLYTWTYTSAAQHYVALNINHDQYLSSPKGLGLS